MEKKSLQTMNESRFFLGFSTSDLLGIVVMIIPFVISIVFEKPLEPEKFLFFTTKKGEIIHIHPNMITSLFSVSFYAALIARYNMFKANNLTECIISSVRAFLNCWVLASLLSIVIPSKEIETNATTIKTLLDNSEVAFFLFAVLLSWLGMKSIAGFSWIIFIFVASGHIIKVNNSMGMMGALFIITTAISLFLQICNYTDITNFLNDFRVTVSK